MTSLGCRGGSLPLYGLWVAPLLCGATQAWPDVPVTHWARQAVISLTNQQMIAGFPDGRFHGGRQLSRYETAALLLRAQSAVQGWQTLQVGRMEPATAWQDIPQSHWARPIVETTVDGFGWLSAWPGVKSGWFNGDKPATRHELALAIASLLPDEPLAGDTGAADSPAWASRAVASVRQTGVMVGDPDGRFHGERRLTRYEAAVAVAKAVALAREAMAVANSPNDPVPLEAVEPVADQQPDPTPMASLLPPVRSQAVNLPRLTLGFGPEFLSELGEASLGEARGWAIASSQLQADWADGPLALTAGWRYAMYGLSRPMGEVLARQDHQLVAGAGYRWLWGHGERAGEMRLLGLGSFLGRQNGADSSDDLLAMDLQAFGLGAGTQWRWPIAHRLVATARTEFYPLLGAQFGPSGAVTGQLGAVTAGVGLDWYLHRMSVGLGYRLRYVYDGERRYSQWANGLNLQAGLAF